MAFAAASTRASRPRSGITLGGLGTGGMELRQDGIFYNWGIFNNRPLGTGPHFKMANDSVLFFVVRFQEKGKEPCMRVLQIEPEYGAAAIIDHPHYYVVPWISGVDKVEYAATFPFATLKFSDGTMPFDVTMEAFSPFIPHDAKNSSLPAVMFDFTITSKTRNPVDVMVMASMRNAVGYDTNDKTYCSAVKEGPGYKAFEMTCDNVDPKSSSWGTMGVASMSDSSTYYLGWEHRHPYYEIVLRSTQLPNTNDTAGRNPKDKQTGKPRGLERCFCTSANSALLRRRGEVFRHSFAAVWHFPNLYAEIPKHAFDDDLGAAGHVEGHYYSNFFESSADVASYVAANRGMLRDKTRRFTDSFYDSSAPSYVLDQVNSQLNTFITSSWLTTEGNFGIVEGIDAHRTYAGLDTTDVAMYGSIAAALLFPDLNRNMLRAYARFQHERGIVAHSINRNFRDNPNSEGTSNRVDMPGQFAFMAVRAFLFSGDRAYLDAVWPSVKKALDYVLRERDMNGDGLPDMEGIMCSYDNFPMFGVSSFVGCQWLAGLCAAVEAARIIGDTEAQERYGAVFTKAQAAFEQKAWNGTYYRLYNDEGGPQGKKDEGCMTDQLLGQWAAHHAGLPRLVDHTRARTALKSILSMNYHPDYGVRNCRWPGDGFLHTVDKDCWVDQANTAWTGAELALAGMLLYEGMYKEALMVVKNVDDRYRNWNLYFDHQEFGGHYFRPMAGWAIVSGLVGLTIKNGEYGFSPKIPGANIRLFFCTAEGYGHYSRQTAKNRETISIGIESGRLSCTLLSLAARTKKPGTVKVVAGTKALPRDSFTVEISEQTVRLTFRSGMELRHGQKLTVTIAS